MTMRQIENRIKKLKELEGQKKALEKQITDLQTEIKDEMKDAEHLTVGDHVIHWTKVVSNRFDSKCFQQDHKQLYGRYIKTVESRRFTVA